jgi:hypothetical protein
MTRISARTTRYEILDMLLDDGFSLSSSADAREVAAAIQHAARTGCLVWTREHIVTTSRPRVATRDHVVYLD